MDWPIVASRLHEIFDSGPSRVYRGHGFSLRRYSRYGVCYREADKELTLMTGDEEATHRFGRTWLFFPTYETLIFVPTQPKWDSGEVLEEEEVGRLLDRLGSIFDRIKEPFRVVIGDQFYQQMWEGMARRRAEGDAITAQVESKDAGTENKGTK